MRERGLNLGLNLQSKYDLKQDLNLVTVFITMFEL